MSMLNNKDQRHRSVKPGGGPKQETNSGRSLPAREECVSASLAVVPRAQGSVAGGAPALTAQKVTLTFGSGRGRAVLKDVSFDVREGEFLCIVGPSGCGKTTLLRLLAGLLTPTGGDIRFQGEHVSGPSRSRAIVFQDYPNALLPWRTV